MNALFAASLFDNPWIVAILVIGGMLANWLAKRRQERQEKQAETLAEEPSPAADKPPGELTLEETLRQLMGGEPPAAAPVPPPLPGAARRGLPPVLDQSEEELPQMARPPAPPVHPPPIAVAQASIAAPTASEKAAQSDRRFEQLSAQGRQPVTVVGHRRGHGSRAAKRLTSPWRDPRSARRAFVASIVFAPPKSLEP